ncbi:hypothetical protein, partial [Aeromonas dhakensis]|uniref:hypothetical protein n=1 Tax=Aeromonas dhakensis TaxID=196024 RepID=UPI003BA24696
LASRGSELIRLACSAVLVRAHYREAHRDDKGFFTKKNRSLRYAAKRFHFALITTISVFHWI